MDPSGCAVSIANASLKVVAALANLKDIKQDSLTLRKLVRRVGTVVEDASKDLDSGSLSKPGAVSALEGLNESMADCLALVERLAKKSPVAKFFTAGNHVAELRAIMQRLSHDLGAFQTSLGIEQHANIEKVLVDLRADLVNLPLEVLHGYEAQAAQLREQLGCMREEARVAGSAANSSAGAALVEERVAAAVLASLEQAGVVKKSNTGMSAQDVADITAALEGELTEMRRDKQDMEGQYLSQIMAALTLRQAEVGDGPSCSSSSSSRAAAAPAASSMPPDFLCPLTMCLMRDPVILETGHSFERQAIQRHLATKSTNPVTNLPLTSKMLIDNIGLRNSIQSWLNQHGLTHEQADSALPAAAAPPVPHLAPTVPVAAQVAQPPVPHNAKEDLEKRDEDGWTPLSWAAYGGHLEAVRELLKAGANKEAADKDGRTPLRWAACGGHLEAVRELLKAGANKEAADKDGWTPLSRAATLGHVEVVRELLKAGANKEAATTWGQTPLSWAAKEGQVEVVRELLKAGANKEAADKWGQTPLSWAAEKGHVEAVRELLKAGANKEAADKTSKAPLSWAAKEGQVEVVRELLKAGANKEAADKGGKKALDYYEGSNEELRALLRGR